MQVHGQVEALTECGNELGRGGRAKEAGHVLDGEDVRTGVDDLLGQVEVVVQRVQVLVGIQEVAGVTHGHFRYSCSRGPDRPDGRSHLVDVIKGVKDPEDIDARSGGFLDESFRHFFRVGRVADGVSSAKQHLEAGVRKGLAQCGQAVPGILAQEP
ncbi:hypothetical protein PJL18_04373 [Paenarthrobacter nicotinovorans]|nr:hypothetical protein [Paenarthrobacter nicotinovorans]